ncbi:MAG: tetratricopeptide repeat protein [Crocinitomicaceae bacterium]|nr:tetratricopeptide repeat protein [Crocinitomicaceae bacterium]
MESTNSNKSETYISAFHEGVRLKLLGNYEEAISRFKTCLKEKPEDDASHFAIAQISLINGDLDQAKYHTIQAATYDKSNLYYQIELGYMYRETGEHEKSAVVFEEIISKRPTNSNYYFESALSWELSGNIKKAISVLNLLEENVGIQTEASLKKHIWFKGLMKMDDAEQELLKVLETENNNQYIIATLVDFYLNTGQIELGMLQLNKLVELDPKNGTGLVLLAQFEFERKNTDKCKELYAKAILSENLMTEEVKEALNFFIHYTDTNSINPILTKVETHYGENDTIMMLLGDIYIENKEFERAIKSYEKALSTNPGNYLIWERVLYHYYDFQQWKLLIERGKEAIKTFPLKTVPYYMLSVSHNQTNQFILAQQYANDGLFTIVDDPVVKSDLQGQLAESYFGQNRLTDAKKEYLKAIETGKGHENKYLMFNFCLRLYEKKVYLDLALSLINELIEENGTNFDLFLLKGDLLFEKKQFNEAKNVYKGLLMDMIDQAEVSEAQAMVNERLGDTFAKLKNIEGALLYWREAARIGPGSSLLEKKILNEAYME